jgi:hypothetical protein
MTPLRWLHATVLLAGHAADLPQADLDQMLRAARLKLNGAAAHTVTLGRVIYHSEGIVLPMSPAGVLAPIFEAAQAATLEVTGKPGITSTDGPSWVPHVTLCYSVSRQATAPVVAALGKTLPTREITIDKLILPGPSTWAGTTESNLPGYPRSIRRSPPARPGHALGQRQMRVPSADAWR